MRGRLTFNGEGLTKEYILNLYEKEDLKSRYAVKDEISPPISARIKHSILLRTKEDQGEYEGFRVYFIEMVNGYWGEYFCPPTEKEPRPGLVSVTKVTAHANNHGEMLPRIEFNKETSLKGNADGRVAFTEDTPGSIMRLAHAYWRSDLCDGLKESWSQNVADATYEIKAILDQNKHGI